MAWPVMTSCEKEAPVDAVVETDAGEGDDTPSPDGFGGVSVVVSSEGVTTALPSGGTLSIPAGAVSGELTIQITSAPDAGSDQFVPIGPF